jgi:cell division protease FtsH
LGGMVAEEIFFGEITSGPASDLKAATTYAAMMVGSLGMDGSLFSYEAVESPHANIVAKVASTDDGKERIEKLLNMLRGEVRTMLELNRGTVEGLRDRLLEREELIADEITAAIAEAAGAPGATKSITLPAQPS